MNHYAMLACRSSTIPPTITLSNYADGSDHESDKAFLSNAFSYSIPNLFRLLTILAKPKNKYSFTYNGVEGNYHSFSVDHNNDYSPLTQFVIGEHIFHVKQVLPGKLLAEQCTDAVFNLPSGELHMMTLPVSSLTLNGNNIHFGMFGLFFKIDSNGKVQLFKNEFSIEMGFKSEVQTSYSNSDVASGSQYCIVYGQNDFVICGTNNNNSIQNFVYIRREESRVVFVTSTNCATIVDGKIFSYDYGNRAMINNISGFLDRPDVFLFSKNPIYLSGNNPQIIPGLLIWCIQKLNGKADLSFHLHNDKYIISKCQTHTPSIAFVIGENR